MKLKIVHKLFLAMLFTTGLGVLVMGLAQRYTFERGFLEYVRENEFNRTQEVSQELVARYAASGSWAFIDGRKRWPIELIRSQPSFRDGRPGLGREPGKPRERQARDRVTRPIPPLWGRVGLLDASGLWVAGAAVSEESVRRELRSHDALIGYMTLAPLSALNDDLDLQFARQQLQDVSLASIVSFLGAALAAAMLANSLGSPIRALARGTQALAAGRYETRLELTRKDELGRLADDFNILAVELEGTRQARQQWVADISHELRTPIAIMQAELEALEDGFRPNNDGAVRSLAAEVKRLSMLVEDLHQLALSDSGMLTLNQERVSVRDLLEDTVQRFVARLSDRSLSMELEVQEIPSILADADRLRQLFANLLENSLRYTDPEGVVRVFAAVSNAHIQITVEDSAPGAPEEAIPRLFDRLFRVDPSRSRKTGASGLGLAICESIVKAHGGSIRAQHSSLGGLAFVVELPIDYSEG
ncbi:MAG: ATP-binding protein [Halioglobus sp.]